MPFPLSLQKTPVTIILLAVIGLLEVLCIVDEDARLRFYNDTLGINAYIWGWQLWRPFTTTLLHANFVHAAFNMLWLATFGAVIENWAGSLRYLLITIALAVLSILPEYVISNFRPPQIMIVGFSGVVYGYFGILLVGRKYRTDFAMACNPNTVQLLIGWFFLCIVLTALDVWQVANVAHGAGWLFGVLLGLSIFRVQQRPLWIPITGIASAAVLGLLLWCPWHFGFQHMKRFPARGRPLLQRMSDPEVLGRNASARKIPGERVVGDFSAVGAESP